MNFLQMRERPESDQVGGRPSVLSRGEVLKEAAGRMAFLPEAAEEAGAARGAREMAVAALELHKEEEKVIEPNSIYSIIAMTRSSPPSPFPTCTDSTLSLPLSFCPPLSLSTRLPVLPR
jgi:hypothetical protein